MGNLTSDLVSLRLDRGSDRGFRWWRVFAAFLAVVAGTGLYYLLAPRVAATEVEIVRPTIQTKAAPIPILTAAGYLVARREAVVSAKIQGRLAELNVDEGSKVQKGQVIARLENAEYKAQVEIARAQVARGEADLAEQERQLRLTQSLAENGIVSRDQLETAMSRVRVAKAGLLQNKADLSLGEANFQNTIIRAPFSGVILKKMAEIGESVAPIPPGVNLSTSSGAIMAMADLQTLEMEVDVSESNVARLTPGQPAQILVEAFPERTYGGAVRQIIPTADRTKATVTVKVTIRDKDERLKPEMSAKVTFQQRPKPDSVSTKAKDPVISVPSEALSLQDGKAFVFEVGKENLVHAVPVVVRQKQRETVITEGLSGNLPVVLHPPKNLKDGDRVWPKP